MDNQKNASRLSREELQEYVIENIDRAVEEGFIKVFYQPVVRTLTEEICGMEALARWDDPDYGLLAPDIFIGALERTRQIHKLDISIIKQICKDYSATVAKGDRMVTISFNLSRLDFQLCDIHGIIEDAIKENDVPREALRVEITESMMENNEERMHDVIDRFWERGLRVWMDDFGSGYSSLNVLKDYRFDTLKIDMIFLKNFNVRSQEIVKSIVDMAKRIGVHTLAEGVETYEQLLFLKNIGCEKAQGFFIGKPMPYDKCLEHLKERGYVMESLSKRQYYHEIGRVNVLSATPLLSVRDNNTAPTYREMQIPMAIVELSQKRIKYLFSNENYNSVLKSLGIQSTKIVEENFISDNLSFGEKFLSMMLHAKKSGDIETINFVRNGCYCFAQVKKIADYPGGDAFLCILQNLSEDSLLKQNELLADNIGSICSIYDRIELVDLETGFSKNIYNSKQTEEHYNQRAARLELISFAEKEVYADDQAEFLKFVDLDTLEERMRESHLNFISRPFRLHISGGTYAWELFTFVRTGKDSERKVLCCSRRMEPYSFGSYEDSFVNKNEENGGISPELLWKNMISHSDMSFFWKDKDRRFLGASRRFLNYFEMDSSNEIIGKNDEDMGWHVNPAAYKRDEEQVLEDGIQTYLVPGTCIARGKIRNIAASKMPIYKDGRIVGLMGYFMDVDEQKIRTQHLETVSMTDSQTGALNFLGLIEGALRYREGAVLENKDFAVLIFDVMNFSAYNSSFGLEWGNKMLSAIALVILEVVGVKGIAGRVSGDHFMVIRQFENDGEMLLFIKQVQEKVSEIREVEGIPCTIYLRKGYAKYSDSRDLQQLFDDARRSLKNDKRK